MRFSCDTPPNPGKRNATECSVTVQRDRITVAVGPLSAHAIVRQRDRSKKTCYAM